MKLIVFVLLNVIHVFKISLAQGLVLEFLIFGHILVLKVP